MEKDIQGHTDNVLHHAAQEHEAEIGVVASLPNTPREGQVPNISVGLVGVGQVVHGGRHVLRLDPEEPGRGLEAGAAGADVFIFAARTSQDDAPEDSLTLFLVDAKQLDSSAIKALDSISDDRFAEVDFEDIVIPPDSVLGEVGEGWPALKRILDVSTAAKCAEMMGGSRKAVDMTIDYVKERSQSTGRLNIEDINRRNAEERRQEKKSSYIVAGIVVVILIVIALYFFS